MTAHYYRPMITLVPTEGGFNAYLDFENSYVESEENGEYIADSDSPAFVDADDALNAWLAGRTDTTKTGYRFFIPKA